MSSDLPLTVDKGQVGSARSQSPSPTPLAFAVTQTTEGARVPARLGRVVSAMIRLARPEQWIKNVIVLLPIVFGGRTYEGRSWLLAGLAAVAFSLAASAVYIMNDIVDRERDRNHPRKCRRPLAVGIISVRLAVVQAIALFLIGVSISLSVSSTVLAVILAYVLLQGAYSFYLKQKVIVDVMCIAIGFVMRAAAGALAIHVEVSPWLVICTFTMCLFMGFCKRRSEIEMLNGTASVGQHRRTLDAYNPEVLTHLTTLSAAVAIISYFLYATSPRTVQHFGTWMLILNSPAVVYGVFRFALLSIRGRFTGPTELILHDRPFQATVAFWIVSVWLGLLWT